jgi:hypothetical protein
MAVYRCLQSGNTVEFTLSHDIKSMEGHSGYVRIDEEEQKDVNKDNQIRFEPVNKTRIKKTSKE